MAINRAPFNALIDDDGSNLVGSVWNKAAISGVILDPVDAAIAAIPASPPEIPAGGAAGDLLTKDPAVAIYGSKWAPPGPHTTLRYGPWAAANLTASGYDNFQPAGGAGAYVWSLNVTVPSNITGILAEPDMTEHLLVNVTGVTVVLQHQHASSAAANRLIGPAFTNYSLSSWLSIRILYSAAYGAWILQKS